MVSETFTIINKQGLHMRPASTFVQSMNKFESDVTIFYNGKEFDGKSIIQVMMSCIQRGAEIRLQCSGPDEAEMLQAAGELIRSGLGDEI